MADERKGDSTTGARSKESKARNKPALQATTGRSTKKDQTQSAAERRLILEGADAPAAQPAPPQRTQLALSNATPGVRIAKTAAVRTATKSEAPSTATSGALDPTPLDRAALRPIVEEVVREEIAKEIREFVHGNLSDMLFEEFRKAMSEKKPG